MKLLRLITVVLISTTYVTAASSTVKKPRKKLSHLFRNTTNHILEPQGHHGSRSYLQIGPSYSISKLGIYDADFTATMFGIQGSYAYKPTNRFFIELKADCKKGSLELDQHLSVVCTDLQEKLGFAFSKLMSKNRMLLVSLFSGFGFRYVTHEIPDSDTVLTLKYNSFYLPLGLSMHYSWNHRWSQGLSLTYKCPIDPCVEVLPLQKSKWLLESTYDNVLIEAPLTFTMYPHQKAVVLKPFIELWNNESTTLRLFTPYRTKLYLLTPKKTHIVAGIVCSYAISL